MDKLSAHGELQRFAVAADVCLDDRAHPEWERRELRDDESEISNYDLILEAIMRGHLVIDENGGAEILWVKPPTPEEKTLKLDPGNWPYSLAMLGFSGAQLNAQRSQAHERATGADNGCHMARAYMFLEVLAEIPGGTIAQLRNRRDCQLAIMLSKFIVSE